MQPVSNYFRLEPLFTFTQWAIRVVEENMDEELEKLKNNPKIGFSHTSHLILIIRDVCQLQLLWCSDTNLADVSSQTTLKSD